MEPTDAKKRALELALRKAGGPVDLAKKLGTTESVLKHYLSGAMVVPDPMYLRLREIIQDTSSG
jgi:hypothetical protein